MKISLLIDMKLPTIAGIFIFISRENFMLTRVKHEKFYKLGCQIIQNLVIHKLVGLEFNGPLNTIKVMTCWSVFGFFFSFFYLGFTALSRIFHLSRVHLMGGGAKTRDPGEKQPDHP